MPSCKECGDTGVIETGNNDLPCDCPAGDEAIFNIGSGQTQTGKEIRAELERRRKALPIDY